MRIEMCGPPTSGKSTIVRGLRERDIRRGSRLSDSQTPKEWQSFVNFINQAYEKTDYKKLPTKTLSSLASAWAGDHSDKIVVFDELVILCGISMAIRLPKEYSIKYFSEAPLPGILIYLTADTETLLSRNEARGEKNRPEKTIRAIKACNEYIPILEERGCNILTFNTSKIRPPLIIEKILEEINAKQR